MTALLDPDSEFVGSVCDLCSKILTTKTNVNPGSCAYCENDEHIYSIQLPATRHQFQGSTDPVTNNPEPREILCHDCFMKYTEPENQLPGRV